MKKLILLIAATTLLLSIAQAKPRKDRRKAKARARILRKLSVNPAMIDEARAYKGEVTYNPAVTKSVTPKSAPQFRVDR